MTTQEKERIDRVIYGALRGCKLVKYEHFYAQLSIPDGIATFDDDTLTRLVFAAHDECLRVELSQSRPGHLKILLHPRNLRDGRFCERHPTLESAVVKWRTTYSKSSEYCAKETATATSTSNNANKHEKGNETGGE